MKKLRLALIPVALLLGFSITVAQSPVNEGIQLKKAKDSQAYTMEFPNLTSAHVDAMNDLADPNGERQMFKSVSVDQNNGSVEFTLSETKMTTTDLQNYLKGYINAKLRDANDEE